MKNTITSISILLCTVFFVNAQTFDWVKQVGGTDNDEANAITTDATGNIYVTGKFGSTADFDPGPGIANLTSQGIFDVFIAKLNSSGDLIWVKQLGGIGSLGSSDIVVDDAGNVYTTGAFEGTADFDPGAGTANLTSNGADDVYISKLDASGNFVWAKSFGGSSYDSGSEIALDTTGNVFVGGAFFGLVDVDPGVAVNNLSSNGSHDIFILKLNSSGDYLSSFNIGSGTSDYLSGLVIDSSNNVYITGDYSFTVDFNPNGAPVQLTSEGSSDAFICKYDADEVLVWAKSIGGNDQEYPTGIALNSMGHVLVTGLFFDTCDVNPGAGVAELVPTPGFGNSFVLSLNSNGSYNWAINIGGTHYTEASDIGVDSDDNIYVYGIYRGTINLNTSYTTNGARDIFVLKLNSSGISVSSYTMGSTLDDYSTALHIDYSNNIYTTGRFQSTVDFEPGTGVTNLTSAGIHDVFIHKMGAPGTFSVEQENNDFKTVVYPNPSSNLVNIQTDALFESVTIYNITGSMVQFENKNVFSIQNLSSGIYALQVKTNLGIQNIRLIKE